MPLVEPVEGLPAEAPPPEVMEHTAQQWEGGAANIGTVESREWPALLRLLDKDDPSWRD